MPVADELPRLGARVREAETVNHVVEPPLEENHQRFAGDAPHAVRALEQPTELPLEQAVHALQLLLLAQLQAVLGEFHASLTVLSGRIVPPLDGALIGVAALSLEKELQPFTPAEPTHGRSITSHALQPPRPDSPAFHDRCDGHTRRLFGGLCRRRFCRCGSRCAGSASRL